MTFTPAYFRDGRPLRFSPCWAGRGLAIELGSRAYAALIAEARTNKETP